MTLIFFRESTPEQEPMKADTDTRDPNRLNAQQNTDDNRDIHYEKRNDKAFTRSWRMIYLELLNLFLVQTGMKYPDLTETGKGAINTMRKASHIAWKRKTVYHLLRPPPQLDTLPNEVEKSLEMRLSPRNVCKGFLFRNIYK